MTDYKKRKDTQSRKYLLTINNPMKSEYNAVYSLENIQKTIQENFTSIKYYCYAMEIGTTEQTPHIHLFLQFKSPVRFSQIKRHFEHAHVDKAKGTASQNRDYVFKTGKWEKSEKGTTSLRETHYESGKVPEERPGKRNDLIELLESIQAGDSTYQIMHESPSFLFDSQKIDKVREVLLAEKYKDTYRHMEVIYIYGSTGVGKSRFVLETEGYSDVFRISNYKHPFDSYKQENILLLDEYRGQFPISDLLKYLEGYPLVLPSRYFDKQACYTKVYIVSNIPLHKQYPELAESDPVTYEALLRRITRILYFEQGESSKVPIQKVEYENTSNEIHRHSPTAPLPPISFEHVMNHFCKDSTELENSTSTDTESDSNESPKDGFKRIYTQ